MDSARREALIADAAAGLSVRNALAGPAGDALRRRIAESMERIGKLEPHEVRTFSTLAAQRVALASLERELLSIEQAGRDAEGILSGEQPDPANTPGRVL